MKAKTPSFVLELKLNTSKEDDKVLDLRFGYGQCIYNVLVRHCRKQLTKLAEDKSYREILSLRKNLPPGERAIADKALGEIRKEYGLTEYALHAFVVKQQHRYKKHIDASTAQKIASSVWRAVEKYLFDNGKQIHFRRREDFLSIEGKSNASGIRFKGGRLYWKGLVIQPHIHKDDAYARTALQSRVKYCRLSRRFVGTRYHYYLQLVLEGEAPVKHQTGNGRCGIDIGPSSVAVVTDTTCVLSVLGEGAKHHQEEIADIERKMDRSRRATNPNNYNPDGTAIKGRRRWVTSNSYRRLARRKASLQRSDAAALRIEHNKAANRILACADDIYVEQTDAAQWAQRTDGPIYEPTGEPCKMRAFGRSIGNHAPALFLRILEQKLKRQCKSLHFVDPYAFRASQYDHSTDEYNKKPLDQRSAVVGGHTVQRDLYSAFLLKNSLPTLSAPDTARCAADFNQFLDMHDECIRNLISSEKEFPSSFGLADFVA